MIVPPGLIEHHAVLRKEVLRSMEAIHLLEDFMRKPPMCDRKQLEVAPRWDCGCWMCEWTAKVGKFLEAQGVKPHCGSWLPKDPEADHE